MANCPKCGAAQARDEVACKKCGLATDRFDSFAQTRDATVPDVLIAAWDRAVEAWDDQAPHDELIRLVTQHDAYAWAAARYRTRPDAIGQRQLERVRKAAEVTLLSAAAVRQASDKKPYRGTVLVLVLLAVALFAGLAMAMVARNRAASGPNPAAATGNELGS